MSHNDNAVSRHDAPIQALVVDDSEDDAFLLRAELAQRGVAIEYRRVDTEVDMTAALANDEWDLIISDHNMPGFDALAALGVRSAADDAARAARHAVATGGEAPRRS